MDGLAVLWKVFVAFKFYGRIKFAENRSGEFVFTTALGNHVGGCTWGFFLCLLVVVLVCLSHAMYVFW